MSNMSNIIKKSQQVLQQPQPSTANYSETSQELKQDDGKLKLDLVFLGMPCVFIAMAKVLMFGLQKGYKKDSWKQVSPERYWAAFYRHINSHHEGEFLAEDSQLPHLWHALVNLAFLVYFQMTERE